jgi:hypothetical protein
VQFTHTSDDAPIPANVVCVTVTIRGSNPGDGGLHITVLTRDPVTGEQRVLESDCDTEPNTVLNPFDPNTRCAPFEELTPLEPLRLNTDARSHHGHPGRRHHVNQHHRHAHGHHGFPHMR